MFNSAIQGTQGYVVSSLKQVVAMNKPLQRFLSINISTQFQERWKKKINWGKKREIELD